MSPILQAVLAALGIWVASKFFRRFIASSPLDKIPGPRNVSWLTGHLYQLTDVKHGWRFHHDVSTQYESVVKIWGFLRERRLYVFDPRALYHVLVKDQNVYIKPHTRTGKTLTALVFGRGLLSTYGDRHKKQRKMMNPVFSMGHMKYMVSQFYQVSHQLCDALTSELATGDREIDILTWMTRTALELIGQAGLGYSFDPLTHEVDNEFANTLKSLVPAVSQVAVVRGIVPWFTRLGIPSVLGRLLPFVPSRRVQRLRRVSEKLDEVCREIYGSKKAALLRGDEAVLEQVGRGKDIMSILLKANMEVADEERLPESEVIAQMATLVLAATDTTTTALARALHMLSQRSDVQAKLRAEIVEARAGREEDLSYEELDTLPYLDAVVRETLRLQVTVSLCNDRAQKDMVLPLHKPITATDGTLLHEIAIPRGTTIVVSLRSLNTCKDYWGADAEEWKPERFLKPLPDELVEAHVPGIYSNMMTFSAGAFSCIGFKFSLLEMKVVLSMLIERYWFSLGAKEIKWSMGGIAVRVINMLRRAVAVANFGLISVPVRRGHAGISYAAPHVADKGVGIHTRRRTQIPVSTFL
ncbi:cytochrome P450 [Punctularia strigosozonata HHB-11173 SS5]|uniref:cytochrome P450 n=1 Tax=Punctularia strigosozonata (strain HHB-11173) TaxID=741275 RepID=UPI0004417AEC|nr:cytochrome P450 [Punctularia strigosozonata HHB-11173 SS5]EIN13011.1 cytochrome P450 [Punctularia strigosozonata HHB-11173 SS5]